MRRAARRQLREARAGDAGDLVGRAPRAGSSPLSIIERELGALVAHASSGQCEQHHGREPTGSTLGAFRPAGGGGAASKAAAAFSAVRRAAAAAWRRPSITKRRTRSQRRGDGLPPAWRRGATCFDFTRAAHAPPRAPRQLGVGARDCALDPRSELLRRLRRLSRLRLARAAAGARPPRPPTVRRPPPTGSPPPAAPPRAALRWFMPFVAAN